MQDIVKAIIEKEGLDNLTKTSLLFDVGRNENDLRVIRNSLRLCRKNIKYCMQEKQERELIKWHTLYRKMLLYAAPYDFDSYLLYLEMQRKPEDRFYYPRRRVLLPVVQAMQKLMDDELDELVVSMPPRIGKTTLLMFFVTWVLGKYPERSNLYLQDLIHHSVNSVTMLPNRLMAYNLKSPPAAVKHREKLREDLQIPIITLQLSSAISATLFATTLVILSTIRTLIIVLSTTNLSLTRLKQRMIESLNFKHKCQAYSWRLLRKDRTTIL